MIERIDRGFRDIRSIEMVAGFHRLAEGSVLYRAGGTVVLATASVDDSVPEFMKGQGKGWITAEYQMHPRSNPKKRESRDGRGRAVGGRTQEIQRLVGRALRAALDLEKLGERTVTIDCDVLEADGGTRTASISAGWVALVLALAKLESQHRLTTKPLRDQVAAISVGVVDEQHLLDLCYIEDSHARVDMNVVATGRGGIVEVQGTAEGEAIPRARMDELVDLGLEGIDAVCRAQRETVAYAGVDLSKLAEGTLFA